DEPVVAIPTEDGAPRNAMRLGAYEATLVPETIVGRAYAAGSVGERHRHWHEINNDYRDRLEEAGMQLSGTSPDGERDELVQLVQETHPFFVGTQAHPEYKSRPPRPHPLFVGLIGAALESQRATRLVEVPVRNR